MYWDGRLPKATDAFVKAADEAADEKLAKHDEAKKKLSADLERFKLNFLFVLKCGHFGTFNYSPDPDLSLGTLLYALEAEGYIPDPGKTEKPETVVPLEEINKFWQQLTDFLESGDWALTVQKADATKSDWSKTGSTGVPLGRLGYKISFRLQLQFGRNPSSS